MKLNRAGYLVLTGAGVLAFLLSSNSSQAWKSGKSESSSTEKKEQTHSTTTGKKTLVKTERHKPDKKGLKWDLNLKEGLYPQTLTSLKNKDIAIDSPKEKQLVGRLNRIMNRLKPHTLLPEIPFEIHLASHETVNAVCYPGGGILFFTGIFDKEKGLINAASDDEIAAVMGHEMAHATLRHAYKKYNAAMATSIIGGMISTGIGIGAGGGWQDFFETVFDLGTGLAFPSYSRKHEAESDLEGIYTVMAAGYKPEAAISLWERAAAKKGRGGKTSIFASHPADGKRAKDLQAHLEIIRDSGQIASKK